MAPRQSLRVRTREPWRVCTGQGLHSSLLRLGSEHASRLRQEMDGLACCSLTNGLSGAGLCFGSGLGGEGTNHQLKVPKTGCEDCCFQEVVPPAAAHDRTHTHTRHTDCRTGCAAGDFKGAPPGLQAILSPPPPTPTFPLPAAAIASSYCAHGDPCPPGRPAGPESQQQTNNKGPARSSQSTPRSGGPAADPNLQGSRLRRPGPQGPLRDGLD